MDKKRVNKLVKRLRKQQRIIQRKIKNVLLDKDFKSNIQDLLLDLSYTRAKVVELKLQ